jgi:parallel beta-helix repeat protein
MNTYNLGRKGLVLGILVLFIGLSVIPSTVCLDKKPDSPSIELPSLEHNTNEHWVVKPPQTVESSGWWDYDWQYRKMITIDHNKVAGDLTNFPVLIHNTSDDFIVHAQPDGDDFVFVSSDNITKYNHEIEHYNSTTGELTAWVNITALSSSNDTNFYLYYGNENCSNQENVTGTWDSSYVSVWHMSDLSGGIYDSAQTQNGSEYGNPIYQQTGKIGYCIDFDGSGDYFDMGDNPAYDFGIGNFTFEIWFKSSSPTKRIIICKKDWGTLAVGYMIWVSETYLQCPYLTYTHTSIGVNEFYPFSDNVWHYIVGVRAGDYLYFYNNSVLEGSASGVGGWSMSNGYNLRIGTDVTPCNFYNGLMDEVRASNIERSSDWISTSYNNQNDTLSFITVGGEQPLPFLSLFYPTDDTFLSKVNPTGSFGNYTYLCVRNTYGLGGVDMYQMNGLVKFNLSSLHQGAIIPSATLHLFYYNWSDNSPEGRELNLYMVTSDWDEDTATWNTRPSYASYPTTNATVPDEYGWMMWDVTDDVQSFVDGQSCNYGWKITDENYWGDANIPITYLRTKEFNDYIPYLRIETLPATVYVDDDFNSSTPAWQITHFNTIQDGIDAVDRHGLVFVYNGTYHENVIVNRAVNLTGENINNTVIDGNGLGDVVYATADEVHITGFTIKNSGSGSDDAGVDIEADYTTIIGNAIISNGNDGIIISSCNSTLIDNIISLNSRYGIWSRNTSNNSIINNLIFSNYEEGIYMKNATDNMITHNNISKNEGYSGIFIWHTSKSTLFNNSISNNNNGIYTTDSDNNTISSNTIKNNYNGIWTTWSDNNKITDNTVTNNTYCGINIWDWSLRNLVCNNTINANELGIYIYDFSSHNTFIDNNITNNDYGVFISNNMGRLCDNNTLYHNNFVNNTIANAFSECWNNSWNNSYPYGGNYWSDFDQPSEGAWDNNSDGIVDSPYYIPGWDNQDHYPLMYPWNGTEPTPSCGDTNADGTINVGDVVYLITYLYRGGSEPIPALCIGDVNCDDIVNIGDVVYLITYLYRGGAAPSPECCE